MKTNTREGWVLQVSAGVGPVEVRRFVASLAEHLMRMCIASGAAVHGKTAHGDEDAPSSVEILLASAPAAVLALAGTHALVARSERRGKNARKRWYAGVCIFPVVEAALPAAIDKADLAVTAMRAGGPGGQHVNKTESAVRVHHKPSGITVRVADERSRHENLRIAVGRIRRTVADQAAARDRSAREERRLAHFHFTRGNPAFVYERGRDGELIAETTGDRA